MNQEPGEPLVEYVQADGEGVSLERENGILRNVKILGLVSRNGRRYPSETLREAVSLYEEAKVNVDHPRGNPLAPRDYRDRLGNIRNVTFHENEGLFADLHFNPRHDLAEQLAWDAEHAPGNVGFSHNIRALTENANDGLVVKKILTVQSVDLVADPATTSGLFESENPLAKEVATLREEVATLRKRLKESVVVKRISELPESRERETGFADGPLTLEGFVQKICR
ncbi:MAG: hypothetical protein Q4D98_02380 [Planctomycetia bacterium]|nr:hypothetical protein [Planctomycetia bacterium]